MRRLLPLVRSGTNRLAWVCLLLAAALSGDGFSPRQASAYQAAGEDDVAVSEGTEAGDTG